MEIKNFLSLMWRSARILAAGLFLGAALGLIISRVQTPVYEATTNILISRSSQRTNTDMLSLDENQLVSTNIQLAKSQPVLDAVNTQMNSEIDINNIQVSAIPIGRCLVDRCLN